MKHSTILKTLALAAALAAGSAQGAEVSDWQALYGALQAGGDIRLTADVAPADPYWADALVVPAGVTATLDLNGHIVDRGYRDDSTQVWDGSVIKVAGKLTILDSDPTAGHGGAADFTDPLGGNIASVTGGIITGGWPDQYGGVYVGGGTFTLQGGTICGNRVGKSSTWGGDGLGAGVYVQNGTFNMSGGAIRFNRAVGRSTIMNSDLGRGGGVYLTGGVFNFSGGTIAGNEAGLLGGGVYVASAYSGHDAKINISGAASVTGNALGGAASNVYLEEGGAIAVAGALSGTVGVTMAASGVFTSGLSGNGTAANFSSDSDAYAVSLTDAGEAQLAVAPPPPPVVSNVVARQRWPWNGLVDVDYEVSGTTDGLSVEIAFAEQGGEGRSWVATKFLAGAEPSAEPGAHRATWDTKAQGVTNVVAEAVIATVKLVKEE